MQYSASERSEIKHVLFISREHLFLTISGYKIFVSKRHGKEAGNRM